MGMAHKAPKKIYKRLYYVSKHAVERLRERLEVAGKTEHRHDNDLGNWLDVMVVSGVLENQKIAVRKDGEEQTLVDISKWAEFPLWAVLRADNVQTERLAIVTVLTAEQSEAMRRNAEPVPKMGDLMPKTLTSTPLRPMEEAGADPDKKGYYKIISEGTVSVAQEEEWLVGWREDGAEKRVGMPETKVRECLSNLMAAGVAPNTIKVWRPVPVKLTVELG